MAKRSKSLISSRKQPQQARSAELVGAILEAAVRVLTREGAQRFTTARVAETAGVSVGSLYQYFPNKASILFRLQSDEWRRTTESLRSILEDTLEPPFERLRAWVRSFIHSECEEAAIRLALNDAAPLYRDAPEARAAKIVGQTIVQTFMREVLPKTAEAKRVVAGNLIAITLSSVGKNLSESAHTRAEINAYADAMTDMFCEYLRQLQHGGDLSALSRKKCGCTTPL